MNLTFFYECGTHTVESPNKGQFGTNINSSGLSPVQRLSSLRDSNRIILIGGIKFGDLVLSIVERHLIQYPFLGGPYLRDSTVSHVQYIIFISSECPFHTLGVHAPTFQVYLTIIIL